MYSDRLEYAIYFATKAHKGQKRKTEDVDMIYHPIIVASILQREGYDEDTVIAGVLHDVVEDTKYSFDDIEKLFGKKVRDYVYDASEPDKSLEWEERKRHTINHIKNAPLESKLIVACDKISNLQDVYEFMKKNPNESPFANLKRGYDKQKWYYTSVYNACIENEDENNNIFKRYNDILKKVFKESEKE